MNWWVLHRYLSLELLQPLHCLYPLSGFGVLFDITQSYFSYTNIHDTQTYTSRAPVCAPCVRSAWRRIPITFANARYTEQKYTILNETAQPLLVHRISPWIGPQHLSPHTPALFVFFSLSLLLFVFVIIHFSTLFIICFISSETIFQFLTEYVCGCA